VNEPTIEEFNDWLLFTPTVKIGVRTWPDGTREMGFFENGKYQSRCAISDKDWHNLGGMFGKWWQHLTNKAEPS
jgi:hypothetical protein